MAERILFFVRSVGLGPVGTSGRRDTFVTVGLLLTGELVPAGLLDVVAALVAVVREVLVVVGAFAGAVR